MPLTLTLTQGALPEGAEIQAIDRITQAFLSAHNLAGNTVMTPNVTAHINILPKNATFAGGKPVEGAWIETKTPSFALADRATQTRFFSEATERAHLGKWRACGGWHVESQWRATDQCRNWSSSFPRLTLKAPFRSK